MRLLGAGHGRAHFGQAQGGGLITAVGTAIGAAAQVEHGGIDEGGGGGAVDARARPRVLGDHRDVLHRDAALEGRVGDGGLLPGLQVGLERLPVPGAGQFDGESPRGRPGGSATSGTARPGRPPGRGAGRPPGAPRRRGRTRWPRAATRSGCPGRRTRWGWRPCRPRGSWRARRAWFAESPLSSTPPTETPPRTSLAVAHPVQGEHHRGPGHQGDGGRRGNDADATRSGQVSCPPGPSSSEP